jgi:hypothetical protein
MAIVTDPAIAASINEKSAFARKPHVERFSPVA